MAVALDGTANGYVSVPATGDLDFSGDFTLECFAKGDSTNTSADTCLMGKSDGGYYYMLRYANLGYFGGYNAGDQNYCCTTIPTDNNWHHWVWMRKGNKGYIIVDGVREGIGTFSSAPSAQPTKEFWIGKFTGVNGFKMIFQEVRASNIARYDVTPYQAIVPQAQFSSDANTMLLLHCTEGSGEPQDSSSGTHHGTMQSGASWVTDYGYTIANPSVDNQALLERSSGKSYTITTTLNGGYPDTGGVELTDDITGINAYGDTSNIAWQDTQNFQMRIDLGAAAYVSEVWSYQNQGDNAGSSTQPAMLVEWSDDDSNWTTAGSKSGTGASSPNHKTRQIVSFAVISHRYWRITCTNDSGASWKFFNDVILFGADPAVSSFIPKIIIS